MPSKSLALVLVRCDEHTGRATAGMRQYHLCLYSLGELFVQRGALKFLALKIEVFLFAAIAWLAHAWRVDPTGVQRRVQDPGGVPRRWGACSCTRRLQRLQRSTHTGPVLSTATRGTEPACSPLGTSFLTHQVWGGGALVFDDLCFPCSVKRTFLFNWGIDYFF